MSRCPTDVNGNASDTLSEGVSTPAAPLVNLWDHGLPDSIARASTHELERLAYVHVPRLALVVLEDGLPPSMLCCCTFLQVAESCPWCEITRHHQTRTTFLTSPGPQPHLSMRYMRPTSISFVFEGEIARSPPIPAAGACGFSHLMRSAGPPARPSPSCNEHPGSATSHSWCLLLTAERTR